MFNFSFPPQIIKNHTLRGADEKGGLYTPEKKKQFSTDFIEFTWIIH